MSARAACSARLVLSSLAGILAAVVLTAGLTLLMSLAVCLGCHPEAAPAAEWAAAVGGLVWAAALMRPAGLAASVGTGAAVGAAWALNWLFLMGRLDPHLWLAQGLSALSWRCLLAWAAAPALGAAGGALGAAQRKGSRLRRAGLHLAIPAAVLLVLAASTRGLDAPGEYALAPGVIMRCLPPDREGTTVRLLTFDFAADPALQIGIYDCDSDDPHPFDDVNTSYLGTPAVSVLERSGPAGIAAVNAGFFTWESPRIGRHVAPVMVDGRARYNVMNRPDVWTFGWRQEQGVPVFRLLLDVPFDGLPAEFDSAIGHVRPLIVDGRPLELKPGAGATRLRCSRTALAWAEPSKLLLLVVRDPDGEWFSTRAWEAGRRQVGGWDLPQVQRFFAAMGVRQALALDGGDSTQLAVREPAGVSDVSSGRAALTLGYLNDRPLRLWLPVLPTRYGDTGVMNYLYFERRSPAERRTPGRSPAE